VTDNSKNECGEARIVLAEDKDDIWGHEILE
jgi:hypothetical protein